jgi:hypothetical protein
LLHLLIIYGLVRFYRENAIMLKANYLYVREHQIPLLDVAINLKHKMLSLFFLGAFFYCMNQFLYVMTVSNMAEEMVALGLHGKALARAEIVNLISIAFLMYILRARDWPQYYSMDVYPFVGGIPVLNALQNNDLMLDR